MTIETESIGARLHRVGKADVCAVCSTAIFLRAVDRDGTEEWAHVDSFASFDKTLCEVGFPENHATPSSPSTSERTPVPSFPSTEFRIRR